MKKILYLIPGQMSTGELGIALSFVKQQDINKYINHFIIPEEKIEIIGENNELKMFGISQKKPPKHNQTYIIELILKEKYDLIILFDAFTFEYAQSWTGLNFSKLKAMEIPIVSLDEYEYTKAGYTLDYYGMFVKTLPSLLEQCDYIVKNCPLSMPKSKEKLMFQGKKANEFYYKAFDELHEIDEQEENCIKSTYLTQANKNAKLVFFTTSKWEVEGAYSFAAQNSLASWIGVILHEYLKELNTDIILLHIGRENWRIPKKDGKVTYIHHDQLPVEAFEKTLQASDLYVTLNIVSITLSKAVMLGVPSLVLNNSKIIEFNRFKEKLKERPLWYQNMARDVSKIYPFSASMFGWNNFLKTVLRHNPYLKSFTRTDMFNYKKTKQVLRDLLFDESIRGNKITAMSDFARKYHELNDSQTILDAIFDDIERKE